LSATGSRKAPSGVICPYLRAYQPSIASVIAASVKSMQPVTLRQCIASQASGT